MSIPQEPVKIAAFDGENADPVNGRPLGGGLRAYTPWGELAYGLAGAAGYEIVKQSDIERVAPGADTLRELFADSPVLILLDELSIYLRKIKGRKEQEQLTPFLTGLFKAVSSSPKACVVFTLAIGKEGKARDAYSQENEFVAEKLEEAVKVAGRIATLLNPTTEDEYAGLAPYASCVARNILWHSFAFNDALQGIDEANLRHSILGPKLDTS